MRELPELFKERMKKQLGAEYEEFLACYEKEGYAGLRVNTGKISVEQFQKLFPFPLKPIPWTESGFYYDKQEGVTKHPYYYAGLYYIQEPSAMLPAGVLPVEPGDRVLDLCAAPGGKATHLAAKLNGKGLLVANDASASRAKALLKNLTVWGCTNGVITGEMPEKLRDTFGCFFDKILVDAPCSGEGMFRKDSGLIRSWEERGPQEYAEIQKQILSCAAEMLRPSGMLLYSTCTFSEEEDEQVISWILEQYPDLELVQPEIPGPWSMQSEGNLPDGFVRGAAPCEAAVRLWPHRICGEGHFLALLHKKGDAKQDSRSEAGKRGGRGQKSSVPAEAMEFLSQLPPSLLEEREFLQIGEQCLLVPKAGELPKGLRYLRTGLCVGILKKGRFEPDQALAMTLQAGDYPNCLNLSAQDERVIRYLKGETISLSAEEEKKENKGWVLICADGYGIGWGKYAGGSVKNKYYPGWRLQ